MGDSADCLEPFLIRDFFIQADVADQQNSRRRLELCFLTLYGIPPNGGKHRLAVIRDVRSLLRAKCNSE